MNQLCLNRLRDDLAGWSVLPLGPQQCAGSKELCHGLQSMTGGLGTGRLRWKKQLLSWAE